MAVYYWKGSTGGTASNYAWNVPQNWVKVVKPNPYSSFSYFVGATNSVPSGGDDVYIGGFITGPTCVSPLVYGGYSGSGNTGSWISNIGGTGPTTAQGQLNSLVVGWQTGATGKYPFTTIGGGKTIVWDMTGSNFSIGVVGTMTPGLTPDSLVGTYYDTLTVLAKNTYETSSSVGDTINSVDANPYTIKLNYALGSTAFSSNLFTNTVIKGARSLIGLPIQACGWEDGGSSSKSKMILSGYLNKVQDLSAPCQTYWMSGQTNFGSPMVYFQGCTFAEYQGNNHCTLVLDENSTAALISINSWFNYPSNVLGKYPYHYIKGEINASKALAVFGLTGGVTGAGKGTLSVNADWYSNIGWQYEGVWENSPLNNSTRQECGFIILSGDDWSGVTGNTRIGEILVRGGNPVDGDGGTPWNFASQSNKPILMVKRGTVIGSANMEYGEMFGHDAPNSPASVGQLVMSRDSTLWTNSMAWQFGVTAGATGATAIVGGIFGDTSTWIRMSDGVQLFNKNLARTFKNTTYSAVNFSSNDFTLEPDNIRREAL
jgi:hypothetical protein